jgi:hypothetical protein
MALSGVDICRACHSQNLFSALNLGELPIANELLLYPSKCDFFPLHLRICRDCGLGQVEEVVSPERLFRDYRYISSISQTFLDHASSFSSEVMMKLDWKTEDWILEIASNDGYMLKNFLNRGIKVLGIEPASNIANRAIANGVPTISEFFDLELAKFIFSNYGTPRLIIANNVYAHVPDIRNFTEALAVLMDERTLVSIENPSLLNLLDGMQFDSIYHEHYSYLSVHSVSALAKIFGLYLVNVEKINTHGGSNRYWLSKSPSYLESSVAAIREEELNGGLLDEAKWLKFSNSVEKVISAFSEFIRSTTVRGEKIAGYGAAAKASTLINASTIKSGEIQFIIDESPEKIGRFMPRLNIPIVPRHVLKNCDIQHLIIFPWNLAPEIVEYIQRDCPTNLTIWCVIPKLRKLN